MSKQLVEPTRRAVVDSLHGLAERCELQLVVAHHAAKLVDLILVITTCFFRRKGLDGQDSTIQSRVSEKPVGSQRWPRIAHGVEEPLSPVWRRPCRTYLRSSVDNLTQKNPAASDSISGGEY